VFLIRDYESEKDKQAVCRMWQEVGWLKRSKQADAATDDFIKSGRALVAEYEDTAEAMAASLTGTMRYLDEELRLAGITAVTVSHIARKHGLAGRLTARLMAEDAAAGAHVMALSMFEKGFYNQMGFGTGGYVHWISFDPAQLRPDRNAPLKVKARIPRRLTMEDSRAIHAARLARLRGHGACNLAALAATRSAFLWFNDGFGLGYASDPDGPLSHYIWCSSEGKHGPYNIWHMIYQNGEQLRELLTLVRSLGDQVHLIKMREPAGIQLQDFLAQPFRFQRLTERSKYECRISARAYWQVRIADLSACLAQTHLVGEPVRFNLELTDPVARFLDKDAPWRGLSGDYVITLGPESSAHPGTDPALPTLKATANAFSRLWLGVRAASSLTISDRLSGPLELLRVLDRVLCLPDPELDWDF